MAGDAAVELGEALPPDCELAGRKAALRRIDRLERSKLGRQTLTALAQQSHSFGARILVGHDGENSEHAREGESTLESGESCVSERSLTRP